MVHVGVRPDDLGVVAVIAGGIAEQQPVIPEDIHGPHDSLVGTLAATHIRFGFKAFHADGQGQVAYALHLGGVGLVHQGGVGKGHEGAVAVFFGQANQAIAAHQGLSAGIDVHVDAEGFALLDDPIQERVVHLPGGVVLCRPAPDAVQIAGRRRIHQDRPRNLHAEFLLQPFGIVKADQARVDDEIGDQLVEDVGM